VRRQLPMRRSIRFGHFGCDDLIGAGWAREKRSCFARCPHLKIEIWGTRLCGRVVADYVPPFPMRLAEWGTGDDSARCRFCARG
jgi:hypothetical protein